MSPGDGRHAADASMIGLLILASPLWLIPLLALAYPFAVLYKRGGWWRLGLLLTAPALLVDVLLNHTSLALLFGRWPRRGEWTFSQSLKNFKDESSERARLAQPVVLFLNHFDPGHV